MNEEIKEILQTLDGISSGDWIQMLPKEATKLLNYITNLQEENQKLKEELLKADSITQSCIFNGKKESEISYRRCLNMLEDYKQENQKLVKVIDTILDFNFFKEECPLNFSFEDEKENKSLDVLYEDEWCETNCNDEYKKCWLRYFNKLTELKGGDKDVEN